MTLREMWDRWSHRTQKPATPLPQRTPGATLSRDDLEVQRRERWLTTIGATDPGSPEYAEALACWEWAKAIAAYRNQAAAGVPTPLADEIEEHLAAHVGGDFGEEPGR